MEKVGRSWGGGGRKLGADLASVWRQKAGGGSGPLPMLWTSGVTLGAPMTSVRQMCEKCETSVTRVGQGVIGHQRPV